MSNRNLSSFPINDYCDNETRGNSGINMGQDISSITLELIKLRKQQAQMQEKNPVYLKPLALTLVELTSDVLKEPCEFREDFNFEQEIEQNLGILGKISDIYVQCLERIENIKKQQNDFQKPSQEIMDQGNKNTQPLTNQSLIFFSNIQSSIRKT